MNLEEQGRSSSTVARHIATLRNFFDFSIKNKYIDDNPMLEISSPRIKRKKFNILSFQEVDNLLSAPNKNTRTGYRDIAIFYILYYTDIKVSELVNFNVDDFNSQIGYIRCKNNRDQDRIVPLDKKALNSIIDYINNCRINLVDDNETSLFVNSNGNRMSRQGFWKIIQKYSKKINLSKNITFNMLRHSFMLHMLQSEGNIDNVDKLLQFMHNNSDI